MIINVKVRHADNIQVHNEIADFSTRYGISGENISAVSWELVGVSRIQGGGLLINEMVSKITKNALKHLTVVIEFISVQPKNTIVQYKKTWGLLSERGINCERIESRINYLFDIDSGLKLIGTGEINILDQSIFDSLIKCNENVYFSLTNEPVDNKTFENEFNKTEWLKEVFESGGVIMMPLGYSDDPSSEIAALGKCKNIEILKSLT